jgi:hypothetical protein
MCIVICNIKKFKAFWKIVWVICAIFGFFFFKKTLTRKLASHRPMSPYEFVRVYPSLLESIKNRFCTQVHSFLLHKLLRVQESTRKFDNHIQDNMTAMISWHKWKLTTYNSQIYKELFTHKVIFKTITNFFVKNKKRQFLLMSLIFKTNLKNTSLNNNNNCTQGMVGTKVSDYKFSAIFFLRLR